MDVSVSEGRTAMTATETATRITEDELAKNLADIMKRVHEHGDEFSVVRDGVVIAVIRPFRQPIGITGRELAKRLAGLEWPDEDFARDLEEAQRLQRPPREPEWPS